MTIDLTPLDSPLGTVATGVDLRAPLAPEDRETVRGALADRLLVVFPGQFLDLDDERRFAESLGPLWHHPAARGGRGGAAAVLDNRQAPNGGRAADVWHADATFTARPPAYTMLSAQVVPEDVGATSFANQQRAWLLLDDAWQARVEGLRAVHVPPPRQLQRSPWLTETTHPVVRVDPATGRRSLFVNPGFTRRFEHRNIADSRPILQFLYRAALHPSVCCDHHWEVGDLVVWDNQTLLHRGHHDIGDATRVLSRVTLAA